MSPGNTSTPGDFSATAPSSGLVDRFLCCYRFGYPAGTGSVTMRCSFALRNKQDSANLQATICYNTEPCSRFRLLCFKGVASLFLYAPTPRLGEPPTPPAGRSVEEPPHALRTSCLQQDF